MHIIRVGAIFHIFLFTGKRYKIVCIKYFLNINFSKYLILIFFDVSYLKIFFVLSKFILIQYIFNDAPSIFFILFEQAVLYITLILILENDGINFSRNNLQSCFGRKHYWRDHWGERPMKRSSLWRNTMWSHARCNLLLYFTE